MRIGVHVRVVTTGYKEFDVTAEEYDEYLTNFEVGDDLELLDMFAMRDLEWDYGEVTELEVVDRSEIEDDDY